MTEVHDVETINLLVQSERVCVSCQYMENRKLLDTFQVGLKAQGSDWLGSCSTVSGSC